MSAPARIELVPVGDLAARVAVLEELVAVLVAGSPRRVYMADVIRFQLPKVLPDLMRRHPQGVTNEIIAEHFGFPLCSTRQAVASLTKRGKVIRHRLRGTHISVLLPPSAEPPEPTMSPQRKRVLETLKRLSVNGRVQMSQTHLAQEVGMEPSTLYYILGQLIADKHVKLLVRGNANRPSAYFIPSAIQ